MIRMLEIKLSYLIDLRLNCKITSSSRRSRGNNALMQKNQYELSKVTDVEMEKGCT